MPFLAERIGWWKQEGRYGEFPLSLSSVFLYRPIQALLQRLAGDLNMAAYRVMNAALEYLVFLCASGVRPPTLFFDPVLNRGGILAMLGIQEQKLLTREVRVTFRIADGVFPFIHTLADVNDMHISSVYNLALNALGAAIYGTRELASMR